MGPGDYVFSLLYFRVILFRADTDNDDDDDAAAMAAIRNHCLIPERESRR